MATPTSKVTILQQARARHAERARQGIKEAAVNPVRRTEYKSLPVPYPDTFLAPLADPSTIKVQQVDFKNSALREYGKLYAVVLDGVMTAEECEELIRMAEMSVGAHGNAPATAEGDEAEEGKEGKELEDNGWQPALVNAGRNHEVLAIHYRNSDRIIWDEKEIVRRIWKRVMQGEGIKDYFQELVGEKYVPVVGGSAMYKREKRVITEQGLNERMRFLRYGPGQFFREHCDGHYETIEGPHQESFYTFHLYLNDSAQALGIAEGSDQDTPDLLRGGATTFHSTDGMHRLDVDPKIGRVLLFQHRRLLHSGDEVTQGIKYTVRSDVMYGFEFGDEDDEDDIVQFIH